MNIPTNAEPSIIYIGSILVFKNKNKAIAAIIPLKISLVIITGFNTEIKVIEIKIIVPYFRA